MKEKVKNANNTTDVNVSNEIIDLSLSGRARDEYRKIRSTMSFALAGVSLTSRETKFVDERIKKIYALGKKAKIEYLKKKDKTSKNELKKLIVIYQYAKNAQKTIERKYILENDSGDEMERKYYISQITRKQAEDEKFKGRKIKNIDVPIVNREISQNEER